MELEYITIDLSEGLPGIEYFVKLFNEDYPRTKSFKKTIERIWSKFSPFYIFRDKYPRASFLQSAISTEKAKQAQEKKLKSKSKSKNKKKVKVVQLSLDLK